MSRRSGDRGLALAAAVVFAVLFLVSLVATALQSWSGRLVLLVVFGGGGWLAVKVWRWLRHRQRIHAQTLGQLLELSPARFEHAVAQLLRDEGYRRVQVHGGAGDLQADVTAVAPDGGAVVVQCKRYAPGNKVGSPAVQSFIGMATVHHRAARGMLVTTSSFTQPAIDLARRHRIELVDGHAMVRRIQRQASAGPASPTPQPATGSSPPPTKGRQPTAGPPPEPHASAPPPPSRTSPPAPAPPPVSAPPPPRPAPGARRPVPHPPKPWTSRGSAQG